MYADPTFVVPDWRNWNPWASLNSRRAPRLTRTLVRARCEDRCEIRWDDACTGGADTLHHVLPRALGGQHGYGNLIGACVSCHEQVHDPANVVPAHRRGVLRGVFTTGEMMRLGLTPGDHGSGRMVA